MYNFTFGKINNLIVHHVGCKNTNEGIRISQNLANLETIIDQISSLISTNFKTDELYHFHFIPSLDLNPVYQFVNLIFKDQSVFVEQSQNCARYLYEKSDHPKIKGGELCIVHIQDCLIDDELVNAIGFVKSENKETILKVLSHRDRLELQSETGININKMDKGCLVFNIQKENGYLLAIVDNTNGSREAQYWKDEFLGVMSIKNDFYKTNQFLGITKQFLTEEFSKDFEITKADQINLLNRSVNYFKEHEIFKKDDFEQKVFGSENMIQSFRKYDQNFRVKNQIEPENNFDISEKAVKKQAKIFKRVLKLDKNFDIHIHGNHKMMEQGIDEDGRKYYKIYYNNES